MRILIAGANFSNKGAQSMLFSVMDQFRKHYGNVDIDYIPSDDFRSYHGGGYRFNVVYGGPQAHKYEDSSLVRRAWILAKAFIRNRIRKNALPVRGHRALHAALKRMDAYIDISGFNLSSKWPIDSNRRYLHRIEMARKYNKKIILLPQSFGPFDYGDDQAEMDERIPRVLACADLIFAREAQGKRLLEEKYGLTNVRLSQDLVLQAGATDWRNITLKKPSLRYPALQTEHNVGIIPNTQTFSRGEPGQILNCYTAIIEELLRAKKQVYIFCHSNDLEACKQIYAPFSEVDGVVLIDQEFSCWEYSEFIGQFDYIIASRFHSIVHAYKRGVPALILGWAIKYQELAGHFEQQYYVFDITRDCRIDALIAALHRLDAGWKDESAKILAALKGLEAHSCFDACWELLDGSTDKRAQQ